MTDLLQRYSSKPVPRYTSYPTAPYFHKEIGPKTYAIWLNQIPKDSTLSLYLHVPYCARLCWFCGCSTTITGKPERIQRYAETLRSEIEIVTKALPTKMLVASVHLGGGTPTMLSPKDFSDLLDQLRNRFAIAMDADIAIEIDPRTLNPELIKILSKSGVTRASVGVQDFTPRVQQAINRIQSFETVREAVENLRNAGITSINLDLMIGLPHQNTDNVVRTVELATKLKPDRVAVFPYAHVPWLKKHQRMIRRTDLPNIVLRREQAEAAATVLSRYGYIPVGQDHFALPNDPLALAARTHGLRRNFQGYTVDNADAIIGFGPSAIGTLPQGYVQNSPELHVWRSKIHHNTLPTERGVSLTTEDRCRRLAIESLMCHYFVDLENVGLNKDTAVVNVTAFNTMIGDDLVKVEGNRLIVTDLGRPFVRNISSCLDKYLSNIFLHSRTG